METSLISAVFMLPYSSPHKQSIKVDCPGPHEVRIQQYRHTGTVKDRLQELADSHGISLATLYRLCGKTPFKELSLLYLDPVYLQSHLPKTMCLWSADFAYALFLDSFQHFSQNDIFRELLKRKGTPCDACPYAPSQTDHSGPICRTRTGTMMIPNNRRTVNRLLSHIPPQMICYCREGIRKWRSDFGHFTLRVRPLLVNELWQGDHHVFDLFVRVKITRQKNDRTYRLQPLHRFPSHNKRTVPHLPFYFCRICCFQSVRQGLPGWKMTA